MQAVHEMAALKVVYLNDFADLDPAQKVLMMEEDAKKRRRREETKIELDRIRDRISFSLGKYEHEQVPPDMKEDVEVSFEKVEDPLQLYELLADARMRSKYERQLMIVLMGFEQQKEKQEEVLQSLEEFFQDMQASNTAKIIEEVAAEEIDFSEATSGIESALTTASEAAGRLVEIKQEIGQLLAVVSQFSDNKKGRRKLEKALVKAQEDVKGLTSSLEGAQSDLEQSKQKCKDLQKTVESKTAECGRLRKSSEQVTTLQTSNDQLKKELADLSDALTTSKEEVERLRQVSIPPPVSLQSMVDERRMREMEEALAAAVSAQEELTKQIKQDQDDHQEEMERLKSLHQEELGELQAQHQEQLQEQQTRHEEQLQSLVVETDVFDYEEEKEEEEQDGEEVTAVADDTGNGEPAEIHSSPQESSQVPPVSKTTSKSAGVVAALKAELLEVKHKSREMVVSLKAKLTESQNKLTNELAVKEEKIAALTMSLSELQEQHQTLEQMVEDMEHQSELHQQQCEHHTATINELQLALQQRQEEEPARLSHPQVQELRELADHSTQWSHTSSLSSIRYSPHEPQGVSCSPKLTPLHASSLLASSATNSIVISEVSAPASSPPLPLGSAVSLGGSSDLPHFPGMGPSRLSKLGFGPEQLTADHPLISEWSKMYELLRKFMENLVERLVAVGGESTVDELTNLDPFSLDSSRDLTGQITQLRFTLTLALHQLETSLLECLTLPELAGTAEESGRGEVDHLKLQVSKLQHLLRTTEDRHHSELRESKDAITNLSLKVESLKAELANLRQRVAQGDQEESGGVTFFTQLDVDRNEKALQQAVASRQLGEDEYTNVSHNMTEYLSIPGQRLAHITQQLTYASQAKRAMDDVEQSVHPRHAAHVIGMLQHLQKRRQEEFEAKMEELSTRRQQLSDDLQTSLTRVEREVGAFLIKPIFPVKPSLRRSLIIPLNRNPPRRPVTTDDSTPHSTTGLIHTTTPLRTADTAAKRRSLAARTTGGTWSVASSRAQSASIPCSPILPRLVELETRRLREPAKLIGHLARRQVSSVPPLPERRQSQECPSLPPIHIPLNS